MPSRFFIRGKKRVSVTTELIIGLSPMGEMNPFYFNQNSAVGYAILLGLNF